MREIEYNKINRTITKWCNETQERDNGIDVAGYRRNEWRFSFEGSEPISITSLYLAIDRGDGLKEVVSFNEPPAINNVTKFNIMVKKRKKLILILEKDDELAAFGFDEVMSDIARVFCYIKTDAFVSVYSASRELNEVNVMHGCFKCADIMTPCILELLTNASEQSAKGVDLNELHI